MHDARLNFVLQEFIAPEYIEAERSDYLLTENQDSGHTELTHCILKVKIFASRSTIRRAVAVSGIAIRGTA